MQATLDATGLRPAKPPIDPALPWPAVALPLLVTVAAILWWRRKPRQPTGKDRQARRRDPIRTLARLGNLSGISRPQLLAATEQIHLALREHLARLHQVPAQRMTTQELLALLDAREADPATRAILAETLEACDLIRFAGWSPPPGHLEERVRILVRAIGNAAP
ncbi:MAG: hypothetical protein VKO64_11910 [Candidatus Sericytochromatia bacterium]|nr:hypothetical protein [Candidatus Sericytochromatia bacterium]